MARPATWRCSATRRRAAGRFPPSSTRQHSAPDLPVGVVPAAARAWGVTKGGRRSLTVWGGPRFSIPGAAGGACGAALYPPRVRGPRAPRPANDMGEQPAGVVPVAARAGDVARGAEIAWCFRVTDAVLVSGAGGGEVVGVGDGAGELETVPRLAVGLDFGGPATVPITHRITRTPTTPMIAVRTLWRAGRLPRRLTCARPFNHRRPPLDANLDGWLRRGSLTARSFLAGFARCLTVWCGTGPRKPARDGTAAAPAGSRRACTSGVR